MFYRDLFSPSLSVKCLNSEMREMLFLATLGECELRGLPVPEVMVGPGCDPMGREGWQGERGRTCAWLLGKAPSCFLPLVGADGARLRLPLAPDNPNKASSLVGAMREPEPPGCPRGRQSCQATCFSSVSPLPTPWWAAPLPIFTSLLHGSRGAAMLLVPLAWCVSHRHMPSP